MNCSIILFACSSVYPSRSIDSIKSIRQQWYYS